MFIGRNVTSVVVADTCAHVQRANSVTDQIPIFSSAMTMPRRRTRGSPFHYDVRETLVSFSKTPGTKGFTLVSPVTPAIGHPPLTWKQSPPTPREPVPSRLASAGLPKQSAVRHCRRHRGSAVTDVREPWRYCASAENPKEWFGASRRSASLRQSYLGFV